MLRDHYVFSNGRLNRKHNTIYYTDDQQKQTPLPVEKIRNLHVFGEVDLNTKLLNYVSQFDICLHIYNYYGFYAGTYYPREKTSVSGFLIIKQAEHYSDRHRRVYLASRFLEGGVHHMLRNLRRHKVENEESMYLIQKEYNKSQEALDIQTLMGHEGVIRKHYYQAFAQMLKQDFSFERREKRPPRDPLNALFSFGNTLMYRTVLSEIYRTTLNPTISYLHEPSTKRFSLSLDIAEIFKPLVVDQVILSLINRKTITKKHFDVLDHEICFLNDEGKKRFIRAWEDRLETTVKHRQLKRNTSYRYLVRLECYKLIKHLLGDDVYKPLKAWW
ncbi:type I-B CRISPR-associated endonuclease Cas1 [Bacillaceae bacterium SIJ1]|uniref:type I-B CRISPR-associated endonuclease Cas1b n=1 Tax=Litoribacterium kuwaitense TaxID=1398745 RepID=UPI0013EB31A4|nr:type I-B CRISPR-associated endonuclease Cas1b [Litoribacterium kuwaitense]NGP44612.1 type I-B CRISPR-associated endonuclease Cas1 [Litoribacterium kuwaitense]